MDPGETICANHNQHAGAGSPPACRTGRDGQVLGARQKKLPSHRDSDIASEPQAIANSLQISGPRVLELSSLTPSLSAEYSTPLLFHRDTDRTARTAGTPTSSQPLQPSVAVIREGLARVAHVSSCGVTLEREFCAKNLSCVRTEDQHEFLGSL
jgi:hypothetical protein